MCPELWPSRSKYHITPSNFSKTFLIFWIILDKSYLFSWELAEHVGIYFVIIVIQSSTLSECQGTMSSLCFMNSWNVLVHFSSLLSQAYCYWCVTSSSSISPTSCSRGTSFCIMAHIDSNVFRSSIFWQLTESTQSWTATLPFQCRTPDYFQVDERSNSMKIQLQQPVSQLANTEGNS